MAWHLEDTRFVEYVPLAEGVWAAVFQGRGRAVAALVKQPGSPAFRVPALAGATARDLYGNPVAAGTPLDVKLVYLTVPGDAGAFKKLKAD
jgi:hypothetical protein